MLHYPPSSFLMPCSSLLVMRQGGMAVGAGAEVGGAVERRAAEGAARAPRRHYVLRPFAEGAHLLTGGLQLHFVAARRGGERARRVLLLLVLGGHQLVQGHHHQLAILLVAQ